MAATYLMCFVCGRKFGSSSLLIHQKTCRSTHELQQAKIPAEFRKVLPPTPPIPKKVTRKSAERFNEQVYELYRSCLMHSCAGCNRSFSDYKKLIAHRDRCDRLKWLNNPLSAGAGGAVAGAGSGGGVLSWKDRKASSGSARNSGNNRDRASAHLQDLSSSFDDSNLSSSPTSVEDSPRSSGSDEPRRRGNRWGVAAVGSSRRAAAVAREQERQERLELEQQELEQQRQKELLQRKKQEEMRKRRQRERERQRLQQEQEAKSLNLSASGSLLFQQAFENGSEASLLEEPDAPAIPVASKGPVLPDQNVAVLSPEVEEARREYHRRRLQLKVARANSPQPKHAAPPIPAAVSHDNSTPASTGPAAIEEDSPEARATMARLKAMYRKRRAKLQSS
eukprot:INCI19851.1.p1 GENE.INCI19851.1~~INCI19851.1.p1  ORF type:complete len:393 (-),score=87.78 INCI19851.1:290-1468(-)